MNTLPQTAEQSADASPLAWVTECQQVLAHAWMVRTFIKHSEEVEDFPELMGIVRSVFDTSRALETRIQDPAAYQKMLTKKIGKLKTATAEFARQAPIASTHTNFQQAVISMQACCQRLEYLLQNMPAAPPIEDRNFPSEVT